MERLGISYGSNTQAKEEPTIDCDIDDNDHTSKRELNLSCEARRIDDVQ